MPSLRSFFCCLAALLAAPSLVSGCSRAGAERGPVEIRYWTGWSGHELDTQKRLVEEFNATHPGVRVRVLSVFNSYQKVHIAFAGDATPDVCSAVWADELAAYAMRGVLSPLDAQLAQSGRSVDEWVPGVGRMLQYRGRTYGLAVTTNTAFIVYNKKIFREVGLDPERPPRTTAELDEASEKCTQIGPNGSLIRYGFRPEGLMSWAYVFGGRWYDEKTGRITANDPHNVEALRWMASYARKHDVTRMQNFESSLGSVSSPNGPFFVGKKAMWQTGEYSLEHIRRYAPDLEWGWFSFPAPPGGRANTTATNGSVFVIPRATKHPREAWEFLNWLSSPYAVGKFCEEISNLPPLKSLAVSPRFRKEPLYAFALDLASGQNVFGPPQTPVWPQYKLAIQRVEEDCVFGAKDPKQALDELNGQMEKELARTLEDAAE
jgi:multiple sugar transport system substrate-binding protein